VRKNLEYVAGYRTPQRGAQEPTSDGEAEAQTERGSGP